MSKLKLIIKTEVMNDLTTKSFWLTTFLIPVLYILFGVFIGFLASESDSMQKFADFASPSSSDEDLTGWQVGGMLCGVLLTLFLMIYGASIYSKVRKEKINRIMEVLATSVTGRTLLLGKVISVLIVAAVQLTIWLLFGLAGIGAFLVVAASQLPWSLLADGHLWYALIWMGIFFFGGYLFYGSIYAACGALTDKDNENQGYMTAITFILLISMYVAQFAVDNIMSPFAQVCSFIPFTASSVATVGAFTGDVPVWETVLQGVVLYAFAFLAISFSGKIYTSSILLKGRKFSPRDIILFLKTK